MATILVVDDRPINREFLATLLGYAGHRVIEASAWFAALDARAGILGDVLREGTPRRLHLSAGGRGGKRPARRSPAGPFAAAAIGLCAVLVRLVFRDVA